MPTEPWELSTQELFSVRGRVAVVTGAASGIGRAIAELFTELGGSVIASDVNAEGLASLVEELRGRGYSAEGYRADITRVEDVRGLFS